ncbi:SLC13 family permease [Eggerthella sp. YY7918]|uniref:SLC13 family permease n=1 Tax=Eggerthella sp. (strain YY7918) TaxID=502558 RepID=UPI00021714FB|nr:SLC13 family permease [Eggerthella sp. YY7918]BAK44923.1 hypothetical protein EGYY_17880 [Eggerthella sp. YY7918]
MNKKKAAGLAVGAIVGIALALLPAPEGLNAVSMRFFGIFAAFIIWMLTGAAPMHVCALVTMVLLIVAGVADFATVFAPFAGTTVWLIIAGFGLAGALVKCGLLKRIAYFIMQFFPQSYRGQIASMFTAGLVVSPLLPSVNAKAVLMTPISIQVADAIGFKNHSKGMAGLWSASYYSSALFGNAFFTGSLWVFVILGFLTAEQSAHWNFASWFGLTWVWLLVMIVLGFFVLSTIFKPKEKLDLPEGFAKQALKDLGPMSNSEKVAGITTFVAILLWMTESFHGIPSAAVAVGAIAAISFFGDFTPEDFRTRIPWDTAVLVGGVIAVANMVPYLGIDAWLGVVLGPILTPLVGNMFVFIPVVCVLVYILRCVEIAAIPTGTIFFAVFGSVVMAQGIDPIVLLFVLFTSVQLWNLPYNQACEIAALASSGGTEVITHNDVVKSSYAFMVINIVALVASVPLWMAMGLC